MDKCAGYADHTPFIDGGLARGRRGGGAAPQLAEFLTDLGRSGREPARNTRMGERVGMSLEGVLTTNRR